MSKQVLSSESSKKPKTKPKISKSGEMILNAIANLKKRDGSSMTSIKKYVIANHNIDFDNYRRHFKIFLAKALNDGLIVNTGGRPGLNGKYKIVDPKLKQKYSGRLILTQKLSKIVESPVKASPKPQHRPKPVAAEKKTKVPTLKTDLKKKYEHLAKKSNKVDGSNERKENPKKTGTKSKKIGNDKTK